MNLFNKQVFLSGCIDLTPINTVLWYFWTISFPHTDVQLEQGHPWLEHETDSTRLNGLNIDD